MAITAYDKFEEAQILIDILRKEFHSKYVIGFCSNHPDAKKISGDWDIDCFSSARDISFLKPTTTESTRTDTSFGRFLIQIRALDSVITSCKALLDKDVDYIVHVHSDAWFLKEQSIYDIISSLEKRGKKLAVRGNGLESVSNPITNKNCSAFGHADDHFFFFEREFFKKHNVFDVKPENLLPHKYSVHGMLMTIFATRVGLENTWYYRNLKDCYGLRLQPLKIGSIKPFSFDPTYHFLHLNRGSLPYSYGKQIQAYFLEKYNLNKNSKFIDDFVCKVLIERDNLFHYLSELDDSLNKKLRIRLHDKKIIDTERIVFKENLLQENFLLDMFRNVVKRSKIRIVSGVENRIEDFNVENIPELYINKYKVNELKNVDGRWTDIYE